MKWRSLSVLLVLALVLGAFSLSAFAEGKYGGTFIFGRGGDSVGLDPIQVTDGESFKVTQQIYDTIVQYKPGTTEVIPGLAKEWEVSDDGLRWTFYLREGVKFHDGNPVNAEAIKWNFDRWRLVDHPYHIGGDFTYYSYMFQGFPGIIKEVNAVDEYTVEFVLTEPQAPFLNNLGMVSFGIASPAAVKKWGEDYFKHPVGSGPFKFVEWKKDDRIVLEANEDYWGGRPYLDKVVFRSIPDNGARYMELQAGTIDMMDYINPEDVASVKENPELDLVLRPSFNVGYFAMHQNFPPFDNVLIRRAFNHAINKENLIGAFYAGLAQPAKNPLPPSLWGYNDEIKDYEYDLEKAKELLAKAGYPDGFEFDLWYMPVPRPYFPQPKLVAQAIQYYLSQIGVKANLKTVDWGTYLDKYYADELPTYLLGWTGDNGDPDNFLYVLLDQTQNNCGYKNDELHEILLEAQRTVDHERRVELYMKAQEIIHNDAPWVPIAHSTPPLVKRSYVKNYIPNPTSTEKFHRVWLDK
ncbi:MAG: peptide/nickel transport system substrate-binding protein [Halanaerobiales bacterium]|nr:peptide/nickel transport system substrate-binding protein [Halanaerobiales bacterium]